MPDESTAAWSQRAAEVRDRLYAGQHRGDLGLSDNPMAELAPEFAAIVADMAMGRQYARPQLELKTRALCTAAALMALGEERYAANWLDHALNVGASRDELIELAAQLFFYLGSPKTVTAFAAVREALRRHQL